MSIDKEIKYELEKVTFTAATEGLLLARRNGVGNKTGFDAVLAALEIRQPRIYAEKQMKLYPESKEYYRYLGQAVDLAVEISETVDQQR